MAGKTVAALIAEDPGRLVAVAAAAGWSPSVVSQHIVESLPCMLTNLTTADLARVRCGENSDGSAAVVKIAQSPRHSPMWGQIPEQFREAVMTELPWRAEADLYASPLASLLPNGMRMPAVYAIEPLDDDRIALWLENVDERDTPWGRDDYRAAATGLGRMAGQLPHQRIPAEIPVHPRDFRAYFSGRIVHAVLPALRADGTWRNPLIAESADPLLRRDLELLAAAMPAVLDRLDLLPRTLVHGDACPQNLLRPMAEPDTIVAIDWTFAGIAAVGLDAAQLVAGRAESGELDPDTLSDVLDDVVDGYAAGFAEANDSVDRAIIRFGVVANLVTRSAFTAVPVELLGDAPTGELASLVARRLRYARFLVDLGHALVSDVPART
jgi:hypothetical protein